MAFLDNSGDIILDAVLTDTGRLRLAQGNGSFKISKFALGDDEINYALYNKDHASGSAYYDLEVLQTPVLEAFTNNTSNLKTKLVSISRTNVLYMPTLKLNKNTKAHNQTPQYQSGPAATYHRKAASVSKDAPGTFYVSVDKDSSHVFAFEYTSATTAIPVGNESGILQGVIQGHNPDGADPDFNSVIRVDQGLDTVEIPASLGLDSDLVETAYIVEMDYRLGRIKKPSTNEVAPVNFIDDDNIASYYLTTQGTNGYVNWGGYLGDHKTGGGEQSYDATDLDNSGNPQAFEGPRGSSLQFRIQASQELQTSTYLFTQIGTSESSVINGNIIGFAEANPKLSSGTTYYIDSTIRVLGANTGFRLDIPVRYVKIVY